VALYRPKVVKFLNTLHGIFVLTTKSATLSLLLFIYRLDKRIFDDGFDRCMAIAQEDDNVCFLRRYVYHCHWGKL
jgi:hypothetical protein